VSSTQRINDKTVCRRLQLWNIICVQSASIATLSWAPGNDWGQCTCEKWATVCHVVAFVTSACKLEQQQERHTNTTVMKISSEWLHKHHCLGRTRLGRWRDVILVNEVTLNREENCTLCKSIGLKCGEDLVCTDGRSEVLDADSKVSLPVMLCSLIQVYRRLGWTCLLHRRGITDAVGFFESLYIFR